MLLCGKAEEAAPLEGTTQASSMVICVLRSMTRVSIQPMVILKSGMV